MKLNTINGFLFVLGFCLVQPLNAQSKKEKTALFYKFTFDRYESNDDLDISEPGLIGNLKGISPSTAIAADVFYGSGDFGIGPNLYGFAKSIDPKSERFEGGDDKLYVSTDDLKDGNLGYAGIVTYKPGKLQVEKTYITVPFVDKTGKQLKMIAGKKYCVELAISHAEASKYATNNIGLMFVKNAAEYEFEEGDEAGAINVEDSRIMYNYKNKVYNSYAGWDKVCGVYVAKGDETGVVIGNFVMNDKTTAEQVKKIPAGKQEFDDAAGELSAIPAILPMAYYFVDNLRIKEVADKKECNCIKVDTAASAVEYSKVFITKEPVISDKMTPEEKISAQVIYYAFGKYKPGETGKNCISYVAEYLNANTSKTITVYTHNDSGEDSLAVAYDELREELENMDDQRGDYIKKSLTQNYGIAEDRIRVISRNAEEPNTTELTEDEDPSDKELVWAYNRRVVFKVD